MRNGVILIIGWILLCIPTTSISAVAFWPIQSIDTMKYSRDISREPDVNERIPTWVNLVASMDPTHIVVATPYNEEFYSVLSTWVNEARKYGMNIWYRGNWSEWEGWFGYETFKDPKDHHRKTFEFITTHPELFKDGDIFTPVPEAENGGPGDPRGSSVKAQAFREFLIESYDTCLKAAEIINIKIICGYYSVNGDIAREIFTKEMVKKTGNVVVIDHFVKTSDQLIADIKSLHEKYDAPIVLGEFGAPIPDIHGTFTETQQSSYIQENLAKVVALGDIVQGVNYWTAFGGSTTLFDEKTLQPKRAVDVIHSFFNSPELKGVVSDQFGNRISNAKISALEGSIVRYTDKEGRYSLPLPGTLTKIEVSKNDEFQAHTFELGLSKEIEIRNITVIRPTKNIIEKILYSIQGLLSKLKSFTVQH